MGKKKLSVNTFEEYPAEALFEYAGMDNIVTSEMLSEIMPEVKRRPAYYFFEDGCRKDIRAPSILSEALDVKADALQFMVDMEVNGIKYDIEGNRRMASQMRERINELEEYIYPQIDKTPESINLDSQADLTKLLYREWGLTPTVFTKKNQPATSGDALKALSEENPDKKPILDALTERNDLESIHSSFLATYIEEHVKRDGRVHPNYNLHGTSSHRISSDNPNLLNLPNPVHGYNIRDLYTVDDGYVFLTFDFSSCEVKVLAALCKDEKMLEAIYEGLDFHTFTASLMYNASYEELLAAKEDKTHPSHSRVKQMRQEAKAVTFGLLYGSSVRSIAMGLGISDDEGRKIVDAYFKAYPRIKTFINDAHSMAKENHWVFNPFGQRKMEYGTKQCLYGTAVYNAAMRNAQNVLIQGPASTLGIVAFSEINKGIKEMEGYSICTVYDSVELQVPINRIADAVELGFYCMDDWPVETQSWLDFPIGADAEVGFRWGSVEDVHRGMSQRELEDVLMEIDPEQYRVAKAA